MKRRSTLFLKAVILLIGIVTFAGMIIFPQLEGRNTNANLFSIYFQDPFLSYVYIASIPFFVALYQTFQLLGYIGQNKAFSLDSVRSLRIIKYCAILLSILIVMAALYIRIFHAKEDDPAGFIALCIVTTFISVVIAIATAVFERLIESAVDIKSENDLTV